MNEDGHVSNSCRGLLAAGLAATVVGSMGVIWTLNANAAETPEAEIPAENPAAAPAVPAEDPVPVPPALLPWGERPHKLTRAKAGASSAAVAAAGADAAPADTSGSLVPKPEFAPKGHITKDGVLRTMKPAIVPPAPPSSAKAAPKIAKYTYAGGNQVGDSDGTWANLLISKPELARSDYHTLAELAVQSADSIQKIEVGWNVDREVNGDDDPHLFIFHWRDNVAQCYNGCGFTMFSKTVKPGDTLPVGAQKRVGIQHAGAAWWIAYDSEWIGYYPDSLWGGKYTKVGFTQWFGEIARPNDELTCTDMGNGLMPEPPDPDDPDPEVDPSDRIGSISHTNGPNVQLKYDGDINTNPKYFPVMPTSTRTFHFGGPGSGPCPK